MEYFWAKADPRISKGIPKEIPKAFFEAMIYETQLPEDGCYLDYVLSERLVVSERIGSILKAYEPGVLWKPIVLVDPVRGGQHLYTQTEMMPVLDCIAPCTEYTQAGYIKHLVLDWGKTEGRYCFYIKTKLETCLMMELSVVESLLRRHVLGLCFKRVGMQI